MFFFCCTQNTFNTYNTYGTNAAYGTYGAYGTNVAHVPNGAYGPSGANGANTQNQMPPPIPLTSISEIVSRLSTDKVEQDMMGQQISQQFGKMSQIVRYNAVRKAYGMNNPVRTFQYAPYNGSCLLDALSQQLWPTSHIGIASTMLRKRVVNYIKADSKRFRPIIETRLKHEYEVVNHGKQISAASLRMKVMKFTSDLSKQSYYGGFETLVAVKETQRSNIFELNAHGAPRFIDGFNHTYTQTLCVYHWSVTAPSDKWEVFTKSYVLHNPYESVISIF